MKTIEQLQAEHAKQIETLKKQHAIGKKFSDAGLPIPEHIGGMLHGAVHCAYHHVGNMSAAIDLMARFPLLVPFAVLKNGCTVLAPESAMANSAKEKGYVRDAMRHSSDYAAEIDVLHIQDSPGPTSAKLGFFARIEGILFDVSIAFGSGYIGTCPALAPEYVVTRGFGQRIQSASFNANRMLYGMADSFLSYGSGDMGPIKKSADHRFLFVADHGDEECPPEQCSHALAQLRSIAEQIKE